MRIPGAATRAVVMAGMLLAGCTQSNSERALRSRIEAAVVAAESRDTGFFRDLIAAGFRDQRGNDRQALVNMIRAQFIINQRVQVVSRIESIAIQGDDSAEMVIVAGLLGRSEKTLALDRISADLYRIELEWAYNGDDWKIIGARWSRLGGA